MYNFLNWFSGINPIIPATYQDALTYLEQLELLKKKLNETIDTLNQVIEAGGSGYILPKASKTELGGIKVGNNLEIDDYGVLSATGDTDPYTLPQASSTVLGGVKIGKNVSIDGEGAISVPDSPEPYTLPQASDTVLGGVKVGVGLTMNPDGVLDAEEYTLPIATKESLGGVKVGDGLQVNSDGVLSATGGGGGSEYVLPIATAETLGGIKVNETSGMVVNSEGVISLSKEIPDPYTLPEASHTVRGGVVLGSGLSNTADGKTFINISDGLAYVNQEGEEKVKVNINTNRGLQNGTDGIGLNIGTGLSFGDNGELNAVGGGGSGDIPIASDSVLGGVKTNSNDSPITVNPSNGLIELQYNSNKMNLTTQYGQSQLDINIGGLMAANKGLEISDGGLMGIKLGAGLKFDENGAITLDATPASQGLSDASVRTETQNVDASMTNKIEVSDGYVSSKTTT